jgi:transposase
MIHAVIGGNLSGMKTPIRVRALTDDEREAVEAGLRSSDASVLRRCQIVLASLHGQTARQIGAALGCSDQWVRDVVHGFNADGLVSLERRSRRPHTIRVAFDAVGCERLRDLLHRSPREFGKPTSVWTLSLLAEVATEEGITSERVSHETIRTTLRRLDIRWQRAKDWLTSPDPAYAQKNSGVTG